MRALLGASAMVALLLLQPVVVAAQRDHRPGLQAQERRAPPRQPFWQREQRAAPGRGERFQGRLTEEERRALRRDVDRANREIYRRRFEDNQPNYWNREP